MVANLKIALLTAGLGKKEGSGSFTNPDPQESLYYNSLTCITERGMGIRLLRSLKHHSVA